MKKIKIMKKRKMGNNFREGKIFLLKLMAQEERI